MIFANLIGKKRNFGVEGIVKDFHYEWIFNWKFPFLHKIKYIDEFDLIGISHIGEWE